MWHTINIRYHWIIIYGHERSAATVFNFEYNMRILLLLTLTNFLPVILLILVGSKINKKNLAIHCRFILFSRLIYNLKSHYQNSTVFPCFPQLDDMQKNCCNLLEKNRFPLL